MSGILIEGATSTNPLAVDSSNQVAVRPTLTKANAGYFKVADAANNAVVFDNNRITLDFEHIIHYDPVIGSAIDKRIWSYSSNNAASTATQGSGTILINASSNKATAAILTLQTYQRTPIVKLSSLYLKANAKTVNMAGLVAQDFILGFMDIVPAIGAAFHWRADGTFACEVGAGNNLLGFDTFRSATVTAPTDGVYHTFEILASTDEIMFYIDGTAVAVFGGYSTGDTFQSMLDMKPALTVRYTVGAVALTKAPQMYLGSTLISANLFQYNTDYVVTQTKLGKNSIGSLAAGTWLQTAQHANSTSATAASLSNTVPSYATLGGRATINATAGSNVDYALFGYLVPAGYRLFITGVRISMVLSNLTIVTTPTYFDWSIAINSTTASIATTDTLASNIWAPRRIALGTMGFPLGQVPGIQTPVLESRFVAPLVIESGRYVHAIMEIPVGTATGSQTFRADVSFFGWFE